MGAQAEKAEAEQTALFELTSRKQAKLVEVEIAKIDVPGIDAFDRGDVKDLADSIRRVGLLHRPILQKENGRFTPIVGRRRCAALQLLATLEPSWMTVEMYVRTDDVSDSDVAKMVLSENARRSANVLCELESINTLMKGDKMTEEGVAKSIGQNVAWVRRRLRLNQLHPKLKKLMEKGRLGFDTAVSVAKLDRKQQDQIVEAYADKKTETENKDAILSAADVSAALSTKPVALPQELFKPLPSPDGPPHAGAASVALKKIALNLTAAKQGMSLSKLVEAIDLAVDQLRDVAAELEK